MAYIKNLRDPVSALTHIIGAILAFIGSLFLIFLGWGDTTRVLVLALYGVSLVLMLTSSGLYHAVKAGPEVILGLRKLDHCAIYLQIAGTYTPICYQYLDGAWRWSILGIIWIMAITGIIVKLFIIKAPRWVTAGIYLIMGWLAIFAIQEIMRTLPASALVWLISGGLFYTIGAIVYIAKKPDPYPMQFGFHEIWHIFVLLGAFSHFFLVLMFIAV